MPKITFIGAGSAVFTRNLLGDILTYPELDGSLICLMDIDAQRLQAVEALAKTMVAQRRSRIQVEATTDRADSLRGADYVFITIQVGGLRAYELDVEIPGKYGVQQCVGDTLGPGGVFRGLRHLAVISQICRELEELSPDALILQYTNPMAIICWAISRISTIRVIGLCHSVQGTSSQLARYIGVPYEDISYLVAGINHVSWFLRFEWNGEDAYPLLRARAEDPEVYGRDPVRFDLLRHFGYFVTESSGHASEYFPYFRKRPDLLAGMVARFPAASTGSYLQYCRDEASSYFPNIEKHLAGREPVEIRRSQEYGAQIIHSIQADTVRRINGNVRNTGLITNLPEGCCVEVPCLVDGTGVSPCGVGELPPQLASLTRTNISVQELTVMGHIHGDRDLVRQAVKLDPLTSAVCSLGEIDSMVAEMFEAQQQWLPQFAS